MKHGDKAKAKASKTKASGKAVSRKASATEKGGKAGKVVKAAAKKESSTPLKGAVKVGSSQKGSAKASPKSGSKAVASTRTNGKVSRAEPEAVTFTNPAIEDAFKRAVKKYPNTFRRLSD